MTSRTLRLAAALAVAALAAAGGVSWWWGEPDPEPTRLAIGTGPAGGVYEAVGQGLREVSAGTSTPVRAVTTAASVANLRGIASGELDGGFTLADVAGLAFAGEAPFDEPLPVRAVARLYDNHTHLVVRADAPYEQVEDLAGQRVSVGARDSGTEMVALRMLDAAGLRDGGRDPAVVVRLDLEESAEALLAGEVEAFFWSGGIPTDAVTRLAAGARVRLIDLTALLPALSAQGDSLVELPVPAGTYPGVPGVRTIGVPSLLVVRADLPDPVVRDLTATLMTSQQELARSHPVGLQLSPRSAVATLPVPLHPGALAYYREVKYGLDQAGP